MAKRVRTKARHMLDTHYVRSSFFGIEDSLVSTTGLIAGISVGTSDKNIVILAGIVAIAVEAISMAAGEFLSEETEKDLSHGRDHANPVVGGLIMLLSYAAAGMVPLTPILVLDTAYALPGSIAAAFIGLYLLGYVRGKITHRSATRQALRVLLVGGMAAIIGIVVGVLYRV